MYGRGFTETLLNPNPGRLAIYMTLMNSGRNFLVWERSRDEGIDWVQGNVYIGNDIFNSVIRECFNLLPGKWLKPGFCLRE